MFVKTKMTTHPFTISPEQTIPEAHEIMTRYDVKRLPVLKNGKLVGVVSKEDIDRYSPSRATSLSMGEITYLLAKTKIKQMTGWQALSQKVISSIPLLNCSDSVSRGPV